MQNSIHVLVISHGYQSDYELGFVNGIALNDVDVTLIGSNDTYVSRLHAKVANLNLLGSKNPNRKIWIKLLNLITYHIRLLKYIATRRPDTIHIIGGFYSQVLFGIIEPLLIRLFSRRVVETVHNLLPHQRHTKWNYWVHWLIYRVPNTLVVHTEKMKTGLVERFGIAPENIIVMQHGVNDPLDSSVPVSGLTRPAPYHGRIRILCFGVITRYKGHDLMIEAMDDLDDGFELTTTGMCRDSEYHAKLEELISRNRNRQRIHWKPGFVADADVNQLFHDSDVVILPYRHIDQSGVLFKALGLGCPVIATDVGSFREYLPPDTGILAAAITAEALRDACLLFRSRINQYDRKTIRSYAEQFLWSRTVRSVIPAYWNNDTTDLPQGVE